MKLTQARDKHGDAVVHKAECGHLFRLLNQGGQFDMEAATRQEAANTIWEDMISEGSMTENDAYHATRFAPCVTLK